MKRINIFAVILSAAAIAPFMQGQESPEALPLPPPAENAALAEAPAPEAPPPVPELTDEQKKQLEIRLLNARKARIDAELALERAKLAEKLAPQNAERSRLETENALRMARAAAKLSETDAAKRRLDAEFALNKVRDDLTLVERGNKLRTAELDFKIARLEQELTLARYSQQIAQVKQAEQLRGIITTEKQDYRKDPLENGKLYISDRRIEFNGVVTPELADYVTERIYFYNNQSAEFPIFIVIDSSPGGNVASGYQIMKAMESSRAPVYVVVKSFAASMAAMITTAAERSFCYPNTVLLQHQPSTGLRRGNLTQLAEQLKQSTEWTRYINDRLAAKMGMTYEEYVAEMYKHNSEGDWSEFGNDAKKWKWVTDVVDTMEETSVVRLPKESPAAGQPNPMMPPVREYKFDERGKPYVELPTLSAPGDAWMIYDPKKLYRVGA